MTVSELCDFIRSGANDLLVAALNETPALVDEKTAQGISLLTYACYCRNVPATELLKARVARLDIFEAACVGDLQALKSQLGRDGETLDGYSPDGFTLLGLSCFFGHAEVAEFLVQRGANVNRASNNPFKVAPIHSACAISDYTLAEMLLKHGADPNARQQAGVTPLHEAAHHGRSDLAQLLLDHGADINARTENGQTSLAMAKEKRFDEVIRLLQIRGGVG